MPIYNYICPKCGKTIEIITLGIKITSSLTKRLCPDCDTEVNKMVSPVNIKWNTDCPTSSGGKKTK